MTEICHRPAYQVALQLTQLPCCVLALNLLSHAACFMVRAIHQWAKQPGVANKHSRPSSTPRAKLTALRDQDIRASSPVATPTKGGSCRGHATARTGRHAGLLWAGGHASAELRSVCPLPALHIYDQAWPHLEGGAVHSPPGCSIRPLVSTLRV